MSILHETEFLDGDSLITFAILILISNKKKQGGPIAMHSVFYPLCHYSIDLPGFTCSYFFFLRSNIIFGQLYSSFSCVFHFDGISTSNRIDQIHTSHSYT